MPESTDADEEPTTFTGHEAQISRVSDLANHASVASAFRDAMFDYYFWRGRMPDFTRISATIECTDTGVSVTLWEREQ